MEMLQVIRPDGTADEDLEPAIPDQDLRKLYRTMVLVRSLDTRMLALQRQGRIGFYVPSWGQEACQVGSAYALKPEDWVFPAYREPGAALWRGFPLYELICQFHGNADDLEKGRQMPNHYGNRAINYVSVSSPVGTQIPLAVGGAWAMKLRKKPEVALVYFGDGATSEGDFHAGMNFAGVFQVPCIFFCNNNQWAISVPVARQTAQAVIARKAAAYGFDGVRVDGNDLLAVYRATKDAVDKARRGGGPTLIEALTYRMGPHSSSDDPSRYRSQDEVDEWKRRDPIDRFRLYLEKYGLWDDAWDREVQELVNTDIMETFKRAEKVPPPPVESLFEDVYAEVPWFLKEEREEAVRFKEGMKGLGEFPL